MMQHLRGRGLAAAKAAMRQPLRRMASLSLNNINQQVLTAEYAVRGPIVLRSAMKSATCWRTICLLYTSPSPRD